MQQSFKARVQIIECILCGNEYAVPVDEDAADFLCEFCDASCRRKRVGLDGLRRFLERWRRSLRIGGRRVMVLLLFRRFLTRIMVFQFRMTRFTGQLIG